MSSPPRTPHGAVRVIVCDYNVLLQSVTGLLRMSGYAVFQAYDGEAAEQLCNSLPGIRLLVLNTEGSGTNTPALVRGCRDAIPGLPVLHIGKSAIPGMPADVRNLSDAFNAEQLLAEVRGLLSRE